MTYHILDNLLSPEDQFCKRQNLEIFFSRRIKIKCEDKGERIYEKMREELDYAESFHLMQVIGFFSEISSFCENKGSSIFAKKEVGNSLVSFLLGLQKEYDYSIGENYRVFFDELLSKIPVVYADAETVCRLHEKVVEIFGENRIAHPLGYKTVNEKQYPYVHVGIFSISPINTNVWDCMGTEMCLGFRTCSSIPINNENIWSVAIFGAPFRRWDKFNQPDEE